MVISIILVSLHGNAKSMYTVCPRIFNKKTYEVRKIFIKKKHACKYIQIKNETIYNYLKLI